MKCLNITWNVLNSFQLFNIFGIISTQLKHNCNLCVLYMFCSLHALWKQVHTIILFWSFFIFTFSCLFVWNLVIYFLKYSILMKCKASDKNVRLVLEIYIYHFINRMIFNELWQYSRTYEVWILFIYNIFNEDV
jgi:hypothetical protein